MRKLKQFTLLALPYVAGACMRFTLLLLEAIAFVKIEHKERVPKWKPSVLVISNHPSLLEAVFLPAILFFSEWVWSPVKWGPWSTPDRANLKKLLWFFWLGGSRNIPIPRKRKKGESREAFIVAVHAARRRINAILKIGGRVVVFAEGGRTTRVPSEKRLQSPRGHEIRPFVDGVGETIACTGCSVLLVWVEYSKHAWPKMCVKFGTLLQYQKGTDPKTIARDLENKMLALADE